MRTSSKALAAATFAALSFAVATPAIADEAAPPSDITVTGAATIASQYRFRGVASWSRSRSRRGRAARRSA